jgi:hypothetical protein
MAKNYVDSILDAAAMASRADTLDGMLNQLPGLLMQQEQQKRAEATEAERYKDQVDRQSQARTDQLNAQKVSNELAIGSVISGIDNPTDTLAALNAFTPSTKEGRLYKSINYQATTSTIKSINDFKNNELATYLEESGGRSPALNIKALKELQTKVDGNSSLSQFSGTLEDRIEYQTSLGTKEFISNLADTITFDESVSTEEQTKLIAQLKTASTISQAEMLLDTFPLKDNKPAYGIEDVNLAIKYANEVSEYLPNTESYVEKLIGKQAEFLGINTGDTLGKEGIIVEVGGQKYLLSGERGSYTSQKLDDDNNFVGDPTSMTNNEYATATK